MPRMMFPVIAKVLFLFCLCLLMWGKGVNAQLTPCGSSNARPDPGSCSCNSTVVVSCVNVPTSANSLYVQSFPSSLLSSYVNSNLNCLSSHTINKPFTPYLNTPNFLCLPSFLVHLLKGVCSIQRMIL